MLFTLTAGLDFSANAEGDALVSEDFGYEVISEEDKTCEITGYTGSATDLSIPSQLNGYTVTSIGKQAFCYNDELTSVIIPESVKTIEYMAFSECSSLSNVTIGSGVTTIGSSAFSYCLNLASIVIPGNVTTVKYEAFYGCHNLANATIGEGVKTIECGAFDFTNITSISIPKSVKEISGSTFSECYHLETINVDSENPCLSSLDGVLFNKNMTTLIKFPIGKTDSSYLIPNTVTIIGEFALSTGYETPSVDNLTDVTIPDSVIVIEDGAFFDRANIVSITLPSGLTAIGEETFAYCKGLKSIEIPNKVESIDDGAFYSCSMLTDAYFSGNFDEWEKISIGSGNWSLTDATIHCTDGIINCKHNFGNNNPYCLVCGKENVDYEEPAEAQLSR